MSSRVQEVVSRRAQRQALSVSVDIERLCSSLTVWKPGIEVTPESRLAFLSESLCIGCGICPKKCPFSAITIINLPTNLESQVTHRYSANSFKLHRL